MTLPAQLRSIADRIATSPVQIEDANTCRRAAEEIERLKSQKQHEKQAADNWAAKCRKAEAERDQAAQKECDNCDDSGYYEEGEEWTPCDECELGRLIGERQDITRKEAAQKEREGMEELVSAVREVMPILNMDGERHPKLEAILASLDWGDSGE